MTTLFAGSMIQQQIAWLVLLVSVVLTVTVVRGSAQATSGLVTACSLASADEIKAAFARKQLGPPKDGRAAGGYSECTFPGLGAGDIRIVVTPPSKDARLDFDLKKEILNEEQKKFETLSGIGDGAYYYDDRLEFLVGNRIAAVWMNRTSRSESELTVKTALMTVASSMTSALRGRP